MSNLGFEPGWINFITRNLISWAKPTLLAESIRFNEKPDALI
jgi:hypothetical protein